MNLFKLLFLFFLVTFGTSLISQNSTLDLKETSDGPEMVLPDYEEKAFIVPFTEKLYHSEIDRKLVEVNKIDIIELRDEIKKGLCFELFLALKAENEKITPYNPFVFYRDSTDAYLSPIYSNVKYIWDDVVEEIDTNQTTSDKIKDRFKKYTGQKKESQQPQYQTNHVQNGQISAQTQYGKKFMNVLVEDKETVSSFGHNANASSWLFINQLDLFYIPGFDGIGNQRYGMRIHYSYLNSKLEAIKSGTIEEVINANQLELKNLKTEAFRSASSKLAQKL